VQPKKAVKNTNSERKQFENMCIPFGFTFPVLAFHKSYNNTVFNNTTEANVTNLSGNPEIRLFEGSHGEQNVC
jgi:hypothetical protein